MLWSPIEQPLFSFHHEARSDSSIKVTIESHGLWGLTIQPMFLLEMPKLDKRPQPKLPKLRYPCTAANNLTGKNKRFHMLFFRKQGD